MSKEKTKHNVILHANQQVTSYVGDLLSDIVNPNFAHMEFPKKNDETNQMQQDYYQQFKKVLSLSYEMKRQISSQKLMKQELIKKIEQLEKNLDNNSSTQPIIKLQRQQSIKKRSRRMADQIERKHKCSVQFCEKEYGSEGSLIQHIKLKHPQLYYPSGSG